MLFGRRRASLSVPTPSWEPSSPGASSSRSKSPVSPAGSVDSTASLDVAHISMSIEGMSANPKAQADPKSALSRSVVALKEIFHTSQHKGAKPYQVALLSDKIDIFDGVFKNVYGEDSDSEVMLARGHEHYEHLATSLEVISKKMSKGSVDLGSALSEINTAITGLPAKLQEDRRRALGKQPSVELVIPTIVVPPA